MKTYEKPQLVALSLSGEDRLCGDCRDNGATYLLHNDESGIADLLDLMIGNGDGTLKRDEVSSFFGALESCEKQVAGYCKFTSVGITVAWS